MRNQDDAVSGGQAARTGSTHIVNAGRSETVENTTTIFATCRGEFRALGAKATSSNWTVEGMVMARIWSTPSKDPPAESHSSLNTETQEPLAKQQAPGAGMPNSPPRASIAVTTHRGSSPPRDVAVGAGQSRWFLQKGHPSDHPFTSQFKRQAHRCRRQLLWLQIPPESDCSPMELAPLLPLSKSVEIMLDPPPPDAGLP